MKKVLLSALAIFYIVILHAQGTYQLWGIKRFGGPDDLGSFFSTDAYGNNFHTRNQIKAFNPGNTPKKSVLSKYGGKFYGVTSAGGRFESGVIFEWDPATNIYAKKIDFNENGGTPSGGLTLFNNRFYGVTTTEIFEWDPVTNIYTSKFNFPNHYQARVFPTGTLMLMNNKFYGITNGDGINGAGGIFEWDPATNVYTDKIDFNSNLSLGNEPCGNLIPANGKFYGMTSYGGNDNGGVIFEWDPLTNIYKIKLNFNNDGYRPNGSLCLNGSKFYGATNLGGSNNLGILFEWDTSGNAYTKKSDLNASTGNLFSGSFISNEGKLYGMMTNGGRSNTGNIFEWDIASGTFTKKIDLDDSTGNGPTGSLIWSDGNFYGMTDVGGKTKLGVLFQWDPATNLYAKKIELDNRESGVFPVRGLAPFNGKLYGMTQGGGRDGEGAIFELDPTTNRYTKKNDFNGSGGSNPTGSLTLQNGKFYGMTSNLGIIFEWDPITNIFTKKIDLDVNLGLRPVGGLTAYNGKFYGTTSIGGQSYLGTIFEWDPVTNIYTKKFDFDELSGGEPLGKLALFKGKFYGVCFAIGAYNVGTLFEWDPSTNVFTKKIEFDGSNGYQPLSTLTLYNNKFYGTTHGGGIGSVGVLFEWDPATNIYTKKIDFPNNSSGPDWYLDGVYPIGSLVMSNSKFYGITSTGGVYHNGVLFEWDPATNVYTKKVDFTEKSDDWFQGAQDLTLVPAPLAARMPGSCINFPSVTIDAGNNKKWISVTDSMGNAVAEINARGNNLGIVTSSMYANNGPVREDGAKHLYLDMNLTITPQFQPATPVDVRIYIKNEEFTSLKNAVNSNGKPSGISSINNIAIYKNHDNGCSPAIIAIADTVATTGSAWEADYVLSASISSFSSFYFADKVSTTLPFTLLEFSGQLQNKNVLLTWKTENEHNLSQFEVERSLDGTNYFAIGSVAAFNTAGTNHYSFTDDKTSNLGKITLYYRLKQKDSNGGYSYSKIITIDLTDDNSCLFFPNPVSKKATMIINISQQQQLFARVIDNSGKIVKQLQWNLPAGSTSLSVDVSKLAKGIYFLEVKGATINEHRKFIRQ